MHTFWECGVLTCDPVNALLEPGQEAVVDLPDGRQVRVRYTENGVVTKKVSGEVAI